MLLSIVLMAAGSLAGHWLNKDSETRNITKMDVTQNDDQIAVQARGKCQPSGTAKGLASVDSASITWDQGFVLRKWVIKREADRLRLEESI